MIKVAMYVHWAGIGGAEDMVIDEIKYADRSQVDFVFVTEEQSGESVTLDEIRSMGVLVHRLRNVGEFRDIYLMEHINVVHVLSCGDIQNGLQAALDLNIPVVDVQACVSYSSAYEKRPDIVQPVYLCQKHWEHGGGGRLQFKVVLGGVDVDKLAAIDMRDAKRYWGFDPAKPVVGWFGRFDQFKCPFSFVEIARRLHALDGSIQFGMWGDGIDRGRSEFIARQQNIPIKFFGMTREKSEAFSAMDVFCFPTWQEAFGRVMAEAMCCGAKIVTSDYPVCKEICGAYGEYVATGRTDPLPNDIIYDYASVIFGMIASPYGSRLESIERAIRTFSAKRMSNDYLSLYKEMLARQ